MPTTCTPSRAATASAETGSPCEAALEVAARARLGRRCRDDVRAAAAADALRQPAADIVRVASSCVSGWAMPSRIRAARTRPMGLLGARHGLRVVADQAIAARQGGDELGAVLEAGAEDEADRGRGRRRFERRQSRKNRFGAEADAGRIGDAAGCGRMLGVSLSPNASTTSGRYPARRAEAASPRPDNAAMRTVSVLKRSACRASSKAARKS